MKCLSRTAMACFCLLLAGNGINACELPAHPNAAAMPVSITPKGGSEIPIKDAGNIVKLISEKDTGNFYYLIPEGSKVKMKIVWDPLCHNSGATGKDFDYKKEQYDYLNDGHIKGVNPDPEVQAAGGYNFFPLSAMSEFFKVSGNRNDIEEAFSRETGFTKSEEIVLDEMSLGPGLLFEKCFAKGGEDLSIEIIKQTTSSYTDTESAAISPKFSTFFESKEISDALPGTHKNFRLKDGNDNKKIYILDNKKLKLQKTKDDEIGFSAAMIDDSEDLVVYSNSGIEMKGIKIGLTAPEPKDYTAYIEKNSNGKEIYTEGIGYDPKAPDAANGGKEGYFDVTFTTPSIDGNGNEDDAVLKIKVESKPAGYKMENMFWVWEEQYYERVKPTEKLEVEGDSSLKEIDFTDSDNADKYYVYKKKDKLKKCSVQTLVTVKKGQDGIGYAGYKIYDNCGPISTNLVLLDENHSFAETEGKAEKSTFKYRINLLDSNPFIDKQINAKIEYVNGNISGELTPSGDLSQNTDKMEVTFFYSYPVYEYETKKIKSIDELKGCGLVDFDDNKEDGHESSFKTYNHKIGWYWKRAVDVKVDSIKLDTQIQADSALDSARRLIGSISTIEGTFTIDNPKPWHVTDSYPKNSNEEDFSNFAVFAVLKDTAGNSHITEILTKEPKDPKNPYPTYADFPKYVSDKFVNDFANKKQESADPENTSKSKFAVSPITLPATNENTRYNSQIGNKNSEILANLSGSTSPYLVDDLKNQANWDTSVWQQVAYLKSEDKTAPEIQVIVLDTRTNRYHIFGTKVNVAAGWNRFLNTDTNVENDYASKINDVPYIGKNEAISKTYYYTGLNNINDLYETYLKGDASGNAVSTVKEDLNKNGFVCQKGTRLVFYVHAFDNIGYNDTTKPLAGLNSLKYKFIDYSGKVVKDDSVGDGFEYVFRQENFDKNGSLKDGFSPYKLIVEADDEVDNHREFELDIGVIGRTLDIRTLEEKRERIE
ncbi:MAG: hypothetical protein II567_04825 [Candidatus Riflebacteria bacterium]|nr:hypothetical protein [Candidatus Riflebacteria bacterium]